MVSKLFKAYKTYLNKCMHLQMEHE
jgi:hypothetical protein